ncbi:transforming growth factor-beta-induced protein ig-h3-like [Mya arenaria]|uniref:transforming growth factor-beta-induced protein ig-h3-like n=1 Tax=Mya arenaria TaxID=6604 RepID=UPI0022E5964D|nr:transforming growth factor-beta-induced protein ig-h3-like [Mya arenaria]
MSEKLHIVLGFLLVLSVLEVSSGPGWKRGHGKSRNKGWSWRLGRNEAPRGHRKFGMDFNDWFDLPKFNLDFSWGHEEVQRNWWEGPNVCETRTDRQENTRAITSHFRFQSVVCDGSDTSFKCVTTKHRPGGQDVTTVLYECCPGFSRKAGDFGCLQEVPLVNLPTLLENLDLTEMTNLLDSVGLTSGVLSAENSNLTVFAPSNSALKKFLLAFGSEVELTVRDDIMDFGSVVMVSKNISESVVEDTRNIMLGHVAVGRLTSSQLTNEMIVETASPLKSSIRINMYEQPTKVVTANCIKITTEDNMATNGVVHVIDDVITPVTGTLLDLVQKNPELSTLKTALGSSRLAKSLREDGSFTLFAPTDAAFKRHLDLVSRVLQDSDCMENLLKNHLLHQVICSTVLKGEAKTKNALNKWLNLTRAADDKLYVEGTQIILTDNMASNGVLYLIDDVLIPDEALDLLELASRKGLTEFVKLAERAGLKKELALTENVTVFMPSNEAIQSLPSEMLDTMMSEQTPLAEVINYHVVDDDVTCKQLYNNKALVSREGSSLRINEYSTFPFGRDWLQTVQCAKFDVNKIKACNGVIYVVDKVLVPTAGTLTEVAAMDPRLSTLAKLLKAIPEIADSLQDDGPYTLFAPTNEAFERMGSDAIDSLMDSPRSLKNVLKDHLSKDIVCSRAVLRANWFDTQKIKTLSGSTFNIRRNRDDEVIIDRDVKVAQADLMATNGVIHVIDAVINDRSPRSWKSSSLSDWLFDF